MCWNLISACFTCPGMESLHVLRTQSHSMVIPKQQSGSQLALQTCFDCVVFSRCSASSFFVCLTPKSSTTEENAMSLVLCANSPGVNRDGL